MRFHIRPVGCFQATRSWLHLQDIVVGEVAIYRTRKKVTIVNEQEVLPLPNVDLEAGRRKPAPGEYIRAAYVEVVLTLEASDRKIPGGLLAIPVFRGHLKLSADDRQHQCTEFGVFEHLLCAIDAERPDDIDENVFRLLVDWQEWVIKPVSQQSVLEETLKGSFLVDEIRRP